MSSSSSFGIADYSVFAVMLASSAAIGIYYGVTGGKQKTTREYLYANKDMSMIPVAFSLMASFMSAITLLGVAAENYVYGSIFFLINISYIIGTPISAYVFLPVFFKIQASSAYHYLELRFGRPTRLVASAVFTLQMVLYMAIVLYAPALALSAVTGLSHWAAIISVGVVCTFYCTLGGMKAVLWTDVLQSILMFASLFIVLIKGSYDVGGISRVFELAEKGGRLNFNNFDASPLVRHTFWSLAIGGIFVYTSIYGVNQAQVQRLLTIRDLRKSQAALLLNWPITTILSAISCMTGLVIYAKFSDCDPLLHPEITRVKTSDQLLPYFVMQSLGSYPGLPGLFVAGIFSGALSTVSSAVNSLAAVTLEDFVRPCFKGGLNDRTATNVSKALALAYGTLCVVLTYVVEQLGSLLQSALMIFGIVGGPLLGVFSLGMLCPKTNQKGAISGLLVSLALSFWIGFGTIASKVPISKLPTTDQGCNHYNRSHIGTTTTTELPFHNASLLEAQGDSSSSDVLSIYRLSYMWYSGFGWLVAMLVGILVSYVTGPEENVDPMLISPVVPKRFRRPKDISNLCEVRYYCFAIHKYSVTTDNVLILLQPFSDKEYEDTKM